MAILNFDATQVQPSSAPDPVPAGWYTAQMSNSGMKPTSDGTGAYLEAEYTILAGDFAGRKLFDRLNLQNKNPVAVKIAYETLSAICHATGVIQVQDSQQLHGKPLQVKVSLRTAGQGADGKHYEASNEIKGYKAQDNASAAGGLASGTPAPPWANAQASHMAPSPPPAPAVQAAPPPPWAAPAAAQAAPPAAPPWQAAQAAPAPAAQAAPPWANQAQGAPVPPWAIPR